MASKGVLLLGSRLVSERLPRRPLHRPPRYRLIGIQRASVVITGGLGSFQWSSCMKPRAAVKRPRRCSRDAAAVTMPCASP